VTRSNEKGSVTVAVSRRGVQVLIAALWGASGCGGGATAEGSEPAAEPTSGSEQREAEAAPTETSSGRSEAVEQAPPPPPLPTLTASDAHTRVIGAIDGSCAIDGVDGGFVYVGSSGRTSSLTRFALAGGPGVVVHRAEGQLDYRVSAGHAAFLENTEGFGISDLGVLPLSGGEAVEVAHGVRVSAWAITADGLYFADPSYSEPRVMRVGLTGGEAVQVEELRPVFDEDRLEQMVASNGELFFVAVRTRETQRGGYFCHELRGGPVGASATLRRYRRCPADDEILDALSVSPGFVYYHRAEGLYRVARAGGREETVISDVRGAPSASASDDRVIVWAQSDGLLRLTLGARAVPEIIGERAQSLGAPFVDDGVVYWTRREAGQQCVVLARPLDAPALAPWDPS
jgi:hypothetical protein